MVATKYTLSAHSDAGVALTGNSRRNMILSVENSLRRLKTDHIDLLWAHFDDQLTPLEEIVRAFDDLIHSGKVMYGGLSNFPAWKISRADTLAELRGWPRIAGIQVEYSLAERSAERELLPMSEALGMAATIWSPLAGGLLTGKYRYSNEGRLQGFGGRLVHTEKDPALLDEVLHIARELNVLPLQVAIAWLRYRAEHTSTALIPIIGSRTPAQLTDTLAGLSVSLTDEHITRLENVSIIDYGTPHNQIAGTLPKAQGAGEYISIRPPRA